MADETATADPAEQPETCANCGRPLGYSSDDQPDWPTGPLCGDCYQARQADDEAWWSELDDTSDEG
jgi:hypothetical protein